MAASVAAGMVANTKVLKLTDDENFDNFLNLCVSHLPTFIGDLLRADMTHDLQNSDQYLLNLVAESQDAMVAFNENVEQNGKLAEILSLVEVLSEFEYDIIAPESSENFATNMVENEPEVTFLKNHVDIMVIEDAYDAFIEETLNNVQGSLQEVGIARFDFLRDRADPSHFVLMEVFKSAEAPAEHKKSAHYLQWREVVADMMAIGRSAIKTQCTIWPEYEHCWDSMLEQLELTAPTLEAEETA